MSFQFNSDKETIKGLSPTVIGSNQFIIKSGTGPTEREIFRALVNDGGQTRIGVNRTGRRVDKIIINSPGFGFTTEPIVEIDAPDQAGGLQAEAQATIQDGIITNVNVTEPGDGYTFAPGVSVAGGGGAGADLAATIDSIDYELDINGAIRTSTSIISDTATILNLDIENFATANTKFRAPHLKNYINGGGAEWNSNVDLETGEFRWYGGNLYQVTDGGISGNIPPTHNDGSELNGQATLKHVGFRVNDPQREFYQELPASGLFPRSITPNLGDRSDKIATTEYVLNLATNDVGGRIYVSEQIGNDLNDGRSAAQPVRTIKRAAQLAWATPGVKESLIVSGGEYKEDNPISLPPDCSVVGDNLRLVIIRPNNPGKDIFKFGDKNYVIGVTYRDKLDVNGTPEGTWRFAMVFDDKQRIVFDDTTNGDFGTEFNIGTRIVGEDKFRLTFSQNGGLNKLGPGVGIRGVNSTALGVITSVTFDVAEGEETQDADGTAEYDASSGAFTSGEVFRYGGTDTVTYALSTVYSVGQLVWFNQNVYEVTNVQGDARSSNSAFPIHEDGDPPEYVGNVEFTWLRDAYTFLSENIVSIRAEGEVVFSDFDTTSTLPIIRVDAGFQGTFNDGFQSEQFGTSEDLGGIVLYTNSLLLASNIHDYKEGQEIFIEGMPSAPNDLTALNGRQRIYKVLEDADGRSRRFVIPKKLPSVTANDIEISGATVRSASHSVTLTLTNSPNKFGLSEPVARRFQDACLLLRNNIDVIADEVVGRVNEEFKKEFWSVYNVTGTTFDIYVGTTGDAHTYYSGGVVTHNGVQYPITGFAYDNIVTGVATVTTSGNWSGVINEDDLVSLNDIILQCTNNGEVIQKEYPSFSIPTGDYKCRRDVGHFLNAMIRDLEFGSNFNTIEAAKKYLDGTGSAITFVDNEIIQTVRALEYARELAIYAIRKWRIGDGTVGNPEYTLQYTSLQKYIDPTVIDDTASPACANVVNAFNTLAYLFVDVLANDTSGTYLDAAYLVARNRHVIAEEAYQDTKVQYPAMGLSDVNERKCRRDINHALSGLIRDLALGGNAGIVTAAEFYFSGASLTGIPEAQRVQTLYAFERAQFYTIAAMRNWSQTGNTVTTTPTNASYDSSTGLLELTIPTPVTSLVANQDRIAFKEGAITFRCDMGSGLQDHPSPTIYDSNYGDSFLITSVVNGSGTVTIQCNVGDAGSAAGVTHIYKESLTDGTILIHDFLTTSSVIPQFEDWSILIDTGAGAPIGQFTPTNAEYNPSNGDFTITVPSGHGVTTNDTMRLAPESFVFTCAMDGNKTEHALPEVGQLAYGTSIDVTGTTATTITMNVGASGPDINFTPQAGTTYDPATGDLKLKIGAHSLDVGEGIVIADNSLTFTCDMDGNQTQKSYPRPAANGKAADYASGRSISIASTTDTTITVNVGVSSDNQLFTPTDATYDPATGDLVLTIGSHGLDIGEGIVIVEESLVFSCDQDNYATPHSYPRDTDPLGGGISTNITAKTETTITLNVGNAGSAVGSAHSFMSAATNAIQHLPQSVHTFVGAATSAVQHLPQVGHTFISALPNALVAGGDYEHRFVGAGTSAITININKECADDIEAVLEAIAFNLTYGGNDKVYDGAKLYIDGAHVAGEETESIYAFEQARDMAIQAMRNETITIGGYSYETQFTDSSILPDSGNPSCATVASAIGSFIGIVTTSIGQGTLPNSRTENTNLYTTETQIIDNTVIGDKSQSPGVYKYDTDCADVASAIGSYIGIVTTTIANVVAYGATAQHAATKTVAPGSLFSVKNFNVARAGYSFEKGDVIRPVGLVTDYRLSEPLNDFTLTVLDTFTDSFALWQFGNLDYIDSIKPYQDGKRLAFPLYYNNQLLSFERDRNADFDMRNLLLIFVNGILQEPGKSYDFTGGTQFVFTSAPKKEDNINVFFYRGTIGADSVLIDDIAQTLKIGDTVQVDKNNDFSDTAKQNPRAINNIEFADRIETDLYSGPGIDETNLRPLHWTKQKSEKVVLGQTVPKTRDSIEGQVYPTTKLISGLTTTSNEIFVENAELFNYNNEVANKNFDLLVVNGISTTPVGSFELLENVSSVQGFAGVITGITSTTGIGTDKAIQFYLSNLESDTFVTAGLSTGYNMYVYDTRVGSGVTTLYSSGSVVGIGSSYIDCIYNVTAWSGIVGDDNVGLVTCNVHPDTDLTNITASGTEISPVGKFTWGRLSGFTRSENPIALDISEKVGDVGLSTYPTIQRRGLGLKLVYDTGALPNRLV